MLLASTRLWFLETRPHFLLLVPVSVLVGMAISYYELRTLHLGSLLLAFLGGLLAHASVNVLNDYFDFRSGIDQRTKRTPFSGGSGFLPGGMLSPRGVYLFGLACLAALVPIGVFFLYRFGWALLPLGLAGTFLVYSYTSYLTHNPLHCLLAPGLGFGPLMVMGVYFTQTGHYSWPAALASLVPGLLVSNLLLLNEFPDVDADRFAHRRHLPIAIGLRKSATVYSLILVACYASIAIFVTLGVLPLLALLGLVTAPLSYALIKGVKRYYDDVEHLIPYLGRNVQVTLTTPLLMSAGIFLQVALLD